MPAVGGKRLHSMPGTPDRRASVAKRRELITASSGTRGVPSEMAARLLTSDQWGVRNEKCASLGKSEHTAPFAHFSRHNFLYDTEIDIFQLFRCF